MFIKLLAPVTSVTHGAVRFEADGFVVWVDPFKVKANAHDADLIICTHAHGDHYAPASIRKIMNDDTLFCVGADVAGMLKKNLGVSDDRIAVVAVGEEVEGPGGISVRAVVAENKNHPAGSGFGVVLGIAGHRYYLSGDTDVLDSEVDCDVLFCVCDGKYNMPDYLNSAPAQILAMKHRPKLVVPYHYDNAAQPGNGQHLADKLNSLGIEAAVLD